MLLLPMQIVHLAVKMTALATLSGTRYAAVANEIVHLAVA